MQYRKGTDRLNKYRDFDNYLKEYPSTNGYFGKYGGNYLEDPELIKAFNEYAEAYNTIAQSAQFIAELRRIRRDFQGRPTPVYHCQNLSNLLGRTQIYLKREDLNHTGAHKLNHCMGEGLLAKYMGKKKLIAETGAGQHGVALATAAAYFGMACDIYMGEVDIAKQAPNVTRMKLLGANVIPVSFGLKTLKEAVDAAFMAYAREYKDAVYCIGTAAGPHPFPLMVRDFQFCIGEEARSQFIEQTGHLPDQVVACVGGGSNSIGMFTPFLADPVELVGVEPLWSPWAAGPSWATTRRPSPTAARVSCTALRALCSPTQTAIRRRSIPTPAAWTIPPPARSTRCCTTWSASNTPPWTTTRPSRLCSCCPGTRASSPPSRAPTPWPTPSAWPVGG